MSLTWKILETVLVAVIWLAALGLLFRSLQSTVPGERSHVDRWRYAYRDRSSVLGVWAVILLLLGYHLFFSGRNFRPFAGIAWIGWDWLAVILLIIAILLSFGSTPATRTAVKAFIVSAVVAIVLSAFTAPTQTFHWGGHKNALPNLPASTTTSTTVVVARDGVGACQGVQYVGFLPDAKGVDFGPDVTKQIANFDKLSPEMQATEAENVQRQDWCKYSFLAYVAAVHRGLYSWPTSDQEWQAALDPINKDRTKHAALVQQIEDWEQANVQSTEVTNQEGPYYSDYAARPADGTAPMLRQAHVTSNKKSTLLRRHLKNGKTLDERFGCHWQLETSEAPPVPEVGTPPATPPKTPPTTVCQPTPGVESCGKHAQYRPPQMDYVPNAPRGPESPTTTWTPPAAPGQRDSGPGAINTIPPREVPTTVAPPVAPPVTSPPTTQPGSPGGTNCGNAGDSNCGGGVVMH